MKKLWKKFDSISDQCYSGIVRGATRMNKWEDGFDKFLEIIEKGRSENPEFAKELNHIDADTDYAHDVYGWLMDYLDELLNHEMYEELEEVCRRILGLFVWEEEFPTEMFFHLFLALEGQGRHEEALEFCEEWQKKEERSPMADAALIHARIGVNDLDGAEKVMSRYISEEGDYILNSEAVYTAARRLYRENGDKKAARKVRKAWRGINNHYSNLF